MSIWKSLHWMGALVLVGVVCLSPVSAQDEKEGQMAPGSGAGGSGAAIDPQFMEVSSEHVASLSRRLMDADALQEIEESIDELLRVIQELLDERQAWFNQRQSIAQSVERVRRDIREVSKEIDDVEDGIAASAVLAAGIPNPELVILRETLVARKKRLESQREHLYKELSKADGKIEEIQQLINQANAALEAKQAERQQMEEHIKEVAIVAPSYGARLLVGSSEELRMSSGDPPTQVVVEVQRHVTQRASSQGTLIRQSWETVYSRTHEWKDLTTAGPGVVALAFKTGTRPQRRSIPIVGLEAFWLDQGEYRARVARVGEGSPGGMSRGEGGAGAGGASEGGGREEAAGPARPSSDQKSAGLPVLAQAEASGGEHQVESMPVPGGSESGASIEWRRFTVVGKLDSSRALAGTDPEPESGGSQIKYGTQRVKPGALRPVQPPEDDDKEDPPDDG